MTILSEQDWNDFIRRVKAEENIKVSLVPTPKLPEALEMVRLWASKYQSQDQPKDQA